MEMQYLIAMLIVVTALANHINQRWVKLPKAIGLTSISLCISLIVILLLKFDQNWISPLKNALAGINFSATFMEGMLSFFLFAGALNINAVDIRKHIRMIVSLATVSVIACSVLIGFAVYYVAHLLHFDISIYYCLVFGALISPTDAVTVMGAMKRTKAPQPIRMRILGESLFNDAAGIFLFVVAMQMLEGHAQNIHIGNMVFLIIRQGFGGLLLGFVLGQVAIYFLKHVQKYEGAVILTMAVVTGGYSLATFLDVSGPIAMVITGLILGQRCRKPFFSYSATRGLYDFWGIVDDVLNAFLFVMIGLEVLSLNVQLDAVLIGVITFFLLVIARGIAVTIPTLLFVPFKKISGKMLLVMSWGGLRGGLSIALALSIPHTKGSMADTIITITYTVVVLSIILQGLSLQPMLNRLYPPKT